MRKYVKILAGLLAALMLAGCDTTPDTSEEKTAEPAEVLTNVYAPVEDMLLPDGFWVYGVAGTTADSVTLLLRKNVKDAETGSLTFFYRLYTAFADGREPEIGTEYEGDCIGYAAWEDRTYFLLCDPEDRDICYIQEYVNGEASRVFPDLQKYTGGSALSPNRVLTDSAGNLYISNWGQVLIVKADFSACLTIGGMDQAISTISKAPDGSIYASFGTGNMTVEGERCMARIDPANGSLTDEQILGSASEIQNPVMSLYDDRYTFFYPGSDGIYGRSAETGEDILLLHFGNSNLRSTMAGTLIPLTGDTIFVQNSDSAGEKNQAIYTRRPDIVYTTEDILYLFVNNSSTAWIDSAVVRFNQSNPGKRIVVKNYWAGDFDVNTGAQKMAMEIETGLASPDLMMGSVSEAGFRYMVEKGRFLDLYAFMENDPVISRDNVFGIVQRCYSHDGKLFALPGSMALQTLLVSRETAAGRTSWTVEEVLDLAEALPEGSVYRNGMVRDRGFTQFLSMYGYHNFVDMEEGTAAFDSDTFRRVLAYIDSITPVTGDEIAMYRNGTAKAYSAAYHTGFRDFMMEDLYFPDGYVRIGFPTKTGESMSMLDSADAIMVADTCENPDLAWEFIRDYVLTYGEYRSDGIMSPVKSLFREELRETIQEETWFRMNTGRTVLVRGELDPDGSYRGNSGQIVTITDAQAQEIMDWLDSTGLPIYDVLMPQEVTSIVSEEISAFLAGANTADGCAKAIQSRVEIWLAERG